MIRSVVGRVGYRMEIAGVFVMWIAFCNRLDIAGHTTVPKVQFITIQLNSTQLKNVYL